MKSNKEFINGIYEKYDEHLNEKKATKQRNIKRIINMAAVIVVLFSTIIVFSERKNDNEPKVIVIGVEKTEENEIKLSTVGNFENFYNVIKEKCNSNNMLQFEESVSESITRDASEIKEAGVKKSETNTQVENVDEADIVKVDDKHIYYVSENKVVIIDAQTPETSDKIAEINYKDANFYPREIYVKNQKMVVIGNEYDIPIEENMRKDVSAMCNLGEGIEEKGIAIGRETGRIEGEAGLILKMHKNGLSAEQIASATDKEIEEVNAIIAGRI